MRTIENATVIAETKQDPMSLETCVTLKTIQNMFPKRNSFLLKRNTLARRF